jgi:hypothetical protein
MVHKPGRELSVTAAYPLLIPFQQRLPFDLAQEHGVGLVQRRPTPLSCHQLNVKELTEVVAKTGEEAEVLGLQRVPFDIEKGQVGRGIGEKRLFKLLQHLQGDFQGVLQEPEAAAVVVVGAGRQVADQVA